MEREGFARYVASHPVDFVRLEWCLAKMLNALIAALSNAIASCGSIYQERPIFLMARQKRCSMLHQNYALNQGSKNDLEIIT